MLPANRSPPMCVDSHVCSGNACESADASGRPRSAQQGSRRPCVQTANTAVSTGVSPTERPLPERVEVERRHVADVVQVRPFHPRSVGAGVDREARVARRPPLARAGGSAGPGSAVRVHAGGARRPGRPGDARGGAPARPTARDAPRRSQLVMVDAVPSSGSSAASLACEHRNDGSVTAAPASSVVERDGLGDRAALRAPVDGRGRGARRDRRAPAPGRGRRARRTPRPIAMAGSSQPGISSRRSPRSTTSWSPSSVRSSQTAPGRPCSTVSSSIASIDCDCTSTPRSSCARVDRNRRTRASVTASASTSSSDGSAASPGARAATRRTATGSSRPSDRERLVERGVLLQRTPDLGQDVAPRGTCTPTVR